MRKRSRFMVAAVVAAAVLSFTVYAAADMRTYREADAFLGGIGIDAGSLPRRDVKRVYRDIKEGRFREEVTREVLSGKAEELGMEGIPQDAEGIYQAIVEYHGLVATGRITSDQIRSLRAGMSYREIIGVLGSTKDIGSGRHVLQYAVDGDKILYLSFAHEDDLSPLSGEELLDELIPAPQDNKDENTFNGRLIQRSGDSILVSCPTYRNFDVISLHITKDTEIVFENGEKATIDDIRQDLTVTTDGSIMKSYPPQAIALRIVIWDIRYGAAGRGPLA